MNRHLAWLMLAAFVCSSACDRTSEPYVEPHPGTPMELRVEKDPPSKAELVKIARYYYPALELAEMKSRSGPEFAAIEHAMPQWKARNAVRIQTMTEDKRAPWRDLVRTLEARLPDYWVVDRTKSYLNEPGYVIEISPRDESREGRLWGTISLIAPVYYIFQAEGDQTEGERMVRRAIDPAFQDAYDALEPELLARYPYHRLDHETALTIVPELCSINGWYRATPLLDLLMFSDWW